VTITNRFQEFVRRAEDVLGWLGREQSLPRADRTVDVPDSDLRYMANKIAEMKRSVLDASLPPQESRYPVMSRIIIDQWPLSSPLGNELCRLEDMFRSLPEVGDPASH
jgi:hypothetical protein